MDHDLETLIEEFLSLSTEDQEIILTLVRRLDAGRVPSEAKQKEDDVRR